MTYCTFRLEKPTRKDSGRLCERLLSGGGNIGGGEKSKEDRHDDDEQTGQIVQPARLNEEEMQKCRN